MVTMVVTGDGSGNEEMQIEIIKENGDTTVCPQMTNYPLDVFWAAGASFPDKTTVVCGGNDIEYGERANCYKLTNSQWESFGQLQTGRGGHAAMSIRMRRGSRSAPSSRTFCRRSYFRLISRR